MDNFSFQYCQKIVLFSEDLNSILVAKRRGEQDYDGVFSLIGGKLETTDTGILDGLKREKDEEIGKKAHILVCPYISYNIFFQKKNGKHMILPHYVAKFVGGEININDEYSEFKWVRLYDLEDFEPKIESIPEAVEWAQRITPILKENEWVEI